VTRPAAVPPRVTRVRRSLGQACPTGAGSTRRRYPVACGWACCRLSPVACRLSRAAHRGAVAAKTRLAHRSTPALVRECRSYPGDRPRQGRTCPCGRMMWLWRTQMLCVITSWRVLPPQPTAHERLRPALILRGRRRARAAGRPAPHRRRGLRDADAPRLRCVQ